MLKAANNVNQLINQSNQFDYLESLERNSTLRNVCDEHEVFFFLGGGGHELSLAHIIPGTSYPSTNDPMYQLASGLRYELSSIRMNRHELLFAMVVS